MIITHIFQQQKFQHYFSGMANRGFGERERETTPLLSYVLAG